MCGSSAGERVAMEKDKTLALEPRVEHNQSSVHNFYINYIVFMALIPQYKKQIGKKKMRKYHMWVRARETMKLDW